MTHVIYMSYAAGTFAFGRAVLDFLLVFGFPRSARKNRTQGMESTMLPQAESAPNAGDRVRRVS